MSWADDESFIPVRAKGAARDSYERPALRAGEAEPTSKSLESEARAVDATSRAALIDRWLKQARVWARPGMAA